MALGLVDRIRHVRRAVGKGVAIGLIALLGGVNVAGTLWGGRVQNVMTTIKVAFVVFLAAAALAGTARRARGLGIALARADRSKSAAGGSASPLAAIMWAYDGWGNVTVLAEELREPERTIPRALVGGVLLVTLLLFRRQRGLSPDAVGRSDSRRHSIPAVEVAKRLLPDRRRSAGVWHADGFVGRRAERQHPGRAAGGVCRFARSPLLVVFQSAQPAHAGAGAGDRGDVRVGRSC